MHESIEFLQSLIEKIADRLDPVSKETISWSLATGRVLAQRIVADRDSPAIDVSSMDGYALRWEDLDQNSLPIGGVIHAGQAPFALPEGAAVKVLTGAAIPFGADVVIRREDVVEQPGRIEWSQPLPVSRPGENIRRRGENGSAGQSILSVGTALASNQIAAMASFGQHQVEVYRKVRLTIINTGDELVPMEEPVEAWQIRDSNGPMLQCLLESQPFCEVSARVRVRDQLQAFASALESALERSDVVVLTGGVSMGDTDQVPDAVRYVGGEVLFHKIPIRPGRPLLMARGQKGQLIVGLPGNPVSSLVTARRFAIPLLRKLGGLAQVHSLASPMTIQNPDDRTLPLVWYRLARQVSAGRVELLDHRGSGDIVSLSLSDGVIELPMHSNGPGPWNWYPWS